MSHIAIPLDIYQPRQQIKNGQPHLWDVVRKKWIKVQPEELVRQWLLHFMIEVLHYPITKIAVEKEVLVFGKSKRFDIVVYDKNWKPWLIAECKAPEIPINDKVLHQLLNYQSQLQASYWLLSNGITTLCADSSALPEVKWLMALPVYQ